MQLCLTVTVGPFSVLVEANTYVTMALSDVAQMRQLVGHYSAEGIHV